MNNKKYNIIYVDPPWDFKNKKTGGSMKSGAAAQYPTMQLDELKKLPVKSICHDDCVLVMWYVGSQPQEALDLVKAWGFTVKNMNGFVWRKLTVKFLAFFGMGFWTRAGSESAIIATRGKAKPVSHSVRAVIEARVDGHSKKPNVFRDEIVKLCGDVPRIELFARARYEGWDAHGDEIQTNNVEL